MLFWIIQVSSQCNNKRGRGKFDTDRKGEGNVTMEADAGVMQPKAKECLEPPEAQQDNEGSFPGDSGESMALLTP